MFKVLISDTVARECIDILQGTGKIDVDVKTDLSPEALKGIINDYDALVVRSATKVSEDILSSAKKLGRGAQDSKEHREQYKRRDRRCLSRKEPLSGVQI